MSIPLHIDPVTTTIGAFVRDLDLRVLDDEHRAALRAALVRHQVLFFRDQPLTDPQLVEVATGFGDPNRVKAFFPRLDPDSPIEVLEAKPDRKHQRIGADQWHSDITFSDNPPTGSVLHARIVPEVGGDTLWTSATAAVNGLPDGLLPYLEGLRALHSIEPSPWPGYFYSLPDGEAFYRDVRSRLLPVSHPVIRTHPVSGAKILYVNPNFTTQVQGVPRQVSDALLQLLFSVLARPEYQVRLRWRPNTVAIWDNRATQHYAVDDYPGQHRRMHRVTFGEEKAF